MTVKQGTTLLIGLAGSIATWPGASAAAEPFQDGGHRGVGRAADTVVEATIVGVVLDAAAPATTVAGALVEVRGVGLRVRTSRDGSFILDGVPSGEHVLRTERTGYQTLELPLTVPRDVAAPLRILLEPAAFRLAEVVATASPFERAAAYQPAAAYSREALQRRAATSLGEMLDGEAGVAMRSFGPVPARPVIRGLDGDRVLVLENGQRMGDLSETAVDHAIGADPLAADQVEVVRGPASLLYGSSALGGVVNILSEDIPAVWSRGTTGMLAAQGGSANRLGGGFGRVVHGGDRWAVTARASGRHAEEVRTPEGRLPDTHLRSGTAGAGVAYGGDAFQGGVSVGALSKRYGIPDSPEIEEERVELRTERQTLQGRAQVRRDAFFDRLELRLSGSRYFHQEIERAWTRRGWVDDAVEHEWLRHTLTSTLTVRHGRVGPLEQGALGLDLLAQSLSAGGAEALTPDARSHAVGGFLLQELPLAPAVRLQLGGRLETHTTRAEPNDRFPDARGQRSAATLSGAVGMNVRPARWLELGLQLARAHRTPSVEELFSFGPHLGTGKFEVGDADLPNEIGHGADLFIRTDAARLHLELAAFYNRVQNFIMLQPRTERDAGTDLPVYGYEADDAVLVGGEIVAEAAVTRTLRLDAVADYVRGTRRGTNPEPLPFMPPLRARLGLTHDPGSWWLGGGLRGAWAQRRVPEGEQPTAGYTLLGLEAGYRMDRHGHHVIALRVENIFDAVYRDHLSRVQDRDHPMPGRNATLSYRWSF